MKFSIQKGWQTQRRVNESHSPWLEQFSWQTEEREWRVKLKLRSNNIPGAHYRQITNITLQRQNSQWQLRILEIWPVSPLCHYLTIIFFKVQRSNQLWPHDLPEAGSSKWASSKHNCYIATTSFCSIFFLMSSFLCLCVSYKLLVRHSLTVSTRRALKMRKSFFCLRSLLRRPSATLRPDRGGRPGPPDTRKTKRVLRRNKLLTYIITAIQQDKSRKSHFSLFHC